jgi:TRAP-type uncharacterized transport system substrate-binding protein
MNRKKWFFPVIVLLMLALAVTGCGGNNATPSSSNSGGDSAKATDSGSSDKGSKDQKLDFVFHTGGQGGGYMAFGAMFVEEWEKNIPGFKASTVTGGSFTNVIKVEQSTTGLELGASFTTVAFDGIKHKGILSVRSPDLSKTYGPLFV